MKTCFVYIRRSSERADKQKNSIAFQTSWVEDILRANPDFDVIGLDGRVCDLPQNGFIIESVSAKEESSKKRSGFQNMMTAIEEHWVDYVLSYYVSRISRNAMDTRVFMDALNGEKKKIRLGVMTQGRTYSASSPNDLIDLEGELFKAKQENSLLSITSTNYHVFLKEKTGLFTSKFPFWYDPLRKDSAVVVNPEKAQLVRLAYEWRLNGCNWTEIAREFAKRGYPGKTGWNIKTAVLHPIQYWEFRLDGKMYPVKNPWYMPIIDKPTYDRLVEYEKLHGGKHWKSNPVSAKTSKKLLDKMAYDVAGQMLQWAITKDKVYYRQRTKGYTYKINVAESKLFREAWKQIHKFSPPPSFSVLIEAQLRNKLALVIKEQDRAANLLEGEIETLKKAIDVYMERLWETSSKLLVEKYEKSIIENTELIESKTRLLEEMKSNKKDIAGTAKMYANLFKDLPGTYKKVSKTEKADILRGLGVSFIVWPDAHITLLGWDFQKLFNPNFWSEWKDNEP